MSSISTRRLLASVAALSFGTAALTAPARADEAPVSRAATDDITNWGAFGVQTQWMDKAVDPGDDFDAFVNGKWNSAVVMPADKTRIGSFIALRDLSDDRVHGLLDELRASKPAAGSDAARVADAYNAFMDTAAIEARGLAPVKPYLDRIYAARTKQDLMRLFASPGYASPLGAGVQADLKDSDRYALYMYLTGLGLPDRDYYLKDTEKFTGIRAKYLSYLEFMLTQAGYKDAKNAAAAVMALETKMARNDWDRATSRDLSLIYNKMPLAEYEKLGGSGLLRTFLETTGAAGASDIIVTEMPPTADELKTAGIAAADAPNLLGGGQPATIKLIDDTPIETWQAYLVAHFLSDNAAMLPRAIDDARFDFYGRTLSGQAEQKVRWKRGVDTVQGQIGELVGKLYAAKYYPPEQKAAMAELVANLRKAMAANLQDLKWMGVETRAQAEAKLNAFTPKIGAPDTFKVYEGLKISATDPLANQMEAIRWNTAFDMNRIGKPVDRAEWGMLPQTVNAYYNPTFNEIVFPAAILQPPFFNLTADPAVNYGAIGGVIGHEMGHGFDDQGSTFDGRGNMRDWWTPADKAQFKKLQDKLEAQYNQFCPYDDGKTCVNGKLTMGENIGDVGGLSLAYRAYKLSLNGKEAPVIGGFTGDQRFFMAWAQVWRAKVREEQARQFLVTDPHSPPQYRINGVVRNFDEWYNAFNVKPGDKLYLPPAERVRIW